MKKCVSFAVLLLVFGPVGLQSAQAAEDQSVEELFNELTIRIKPQTKPSTKFALMLEALEQNPKVRPVFLKKLSELLSAIPKEEQFSLSIYKQKVTKLQSLETLSKDEIKHLFEQLNLSNSDRIAFAEYCWDQDWKDTSYKVAFNLEDRKRFGAHAAEIQKTVIEAKQNPFKNNNETLWVAMLTRNLWSSYCNFISCYDSKERGYSAHKMIGSLVGMMTLFGEDQVREWVTDFDRRKRWIEDPFIIGCYFYQIGKVKEAFAYFEDSKKTDETIYARMCVHAGRYDKFIHLIQKRSDKNQGGKSRWEDHFALAFAAEQIGDKELYARSHKALFELEVDPSHENTVTKQIQRFLALSDMQKAMQVAYTMDAKVDLFQLLCLSYEYDKAHQFVEMCKMIDPEGAKPLVKEAETFFKRFNHQHARSYDPQWQTKSYKKKYEPAAQIIRDQMQQEQYIDGRLFTELSMEKEDKKLEAEIVQYLMKGKFKGRGEARRFLEKHGKVNFLRDFYFKKWSESHYQVDALYLAGKYSKQLGEDKKGERLILASYALTFGRDRRAKNIVNLKNAFEEKDPYLAKLDAISQRGIIFSPSGRHLYNQAFSEKSYDLAARAWNFNHLYTLYSEGSPSYSYGKHWWAWHNNAHDDEALGHQALEKGQLDKAYQHLQKVRVVSENRFQLGKKLYFAYLKKGDKEKAEAIFDAHWDEMEAIHNKNRNYYWAMSHLVRWSLDCRNIRSSKGLGYAQALQALRGDRYIESRLLAEHYVLVKRPDQARKILEPWLKRRPRDKELQEFTKTLILPERNLLEDGTYFGSQNWF